MHPPDCGQEPRLRALREECGFNWPSQEALDKLLGGKGKKSSRFLHDASLQTRGRQSGDRLGLNQTI